MPVSGKGVITKSIGLQENYIDVFEVAESKPDEEKSGCAGCPLCRAKCQMRDSGRREAVEILESKCRNARRLSTRKLIPKRKSTSTKRTSTATGRP